MTEKEKNRIAVLDGLRALAIFLVMARHSMRAFWDATAISSFDLGAVLINGWIGVDLFFVLSGFLITRQLIKLDGTRIGLLQYFKRRVLRIAPAYYLVLTAVCLGAFPYFQAANPETVWGWRYIYHLLFLQDYWPSDICVVFWSLAIEMKFYILAPLLVAVLMRCRQGYRYILLFSLMMLMIFLRFMTVKVWQAPFDDYETYFALLRNKFHLSLDGLLMGMMCAFIWNDARLRSWIEKPHVAQTLFFGGVTAIGALAIPVPLMEGGISLFDKTALFTCLAFGFGAMMLGLLGGAAGGRIFSRPGLGFVAKISYSLYLVHWPLIPLAFLGTQAAFGPLTGVAGWLVFLPVFVLLSAALSLLIYKMVERPAMTYAERA